VQQEPGALERRPQVVRYAPVSRQIRLRQAIRRFTMRASSTCTAVRTCSGRHVFNNLQATFSDLFHYYSNSRLQARRDLSQTVVSGVKKLVGLVSLKLQRVAQNRFRASSITTSPFQAIARSTRKALAAEDSSTLNVVSEPENAAE
jgi:hypothetical protein